MKTLHNHLGSYQKNFGWPISRFSTSKIHFSKTYLRKKRYPILLIDFEDFHPQKIVVFRESVSLIVLTV